MEYTSGRNLKVSLLDPSPLLHAQQGRRVEERRVVPVPADAAAVERDQGVDVVRAHEVLQDLGDQLLAPPDGGVIT